MQTLSPRFFKSLPPFPQAATQEERRAQLFKMCSVMAEQCFDSNGVWKMPSLSPDARERLWICLGLLGGNEKDIALANAILAETTYKNHTDTPAEKDFVHPFDVFVSNHCVQLLVLHADKLLPHVRRKMEAWARVAIGPYPSDRQSDLQFHGYNDNMPAKASMGMILGGEYFGDTAAVEQGLWSLRQLRDMLTRRGLISEYNTPTYSPLTIGNLSEIAQHAKNAEARSLAAQLAERVWADVLGHVHLPTGSSAGPFSRAYTSDSTAYLSNLNCMLWLLLGDVIWPHLPEDLAADPIPIFMPRAGDVLFVLAQSCWLATFHWDAPAYLMEWLQTRKYPFHLIATAERAEGGDESFHASEIITTSYQEEDFTLGSCTGDWIGLGDEVFFSYRRHAPVRGYHDVRTGYPKYQINNNTPGEIGTNPNGLFQGETGSVNDEARYITVQRGPVVLACAGPVLRLAGQSISRMGLSLLMREHASKIEHIEVADGHVWMKDGPFHLAVRPLGATNWGRSAALSIPSINQYRMIWMPNYEGEARTFTRKELACTVNGFVIVTGSERTETFDAFRARVKRAVVLDYYTAVSRTVRYRLDGLELGMNYGIWSGQTRFVTINGKVAPRPIWDATDLPADRLPFLDQQPPTNALTIPFPELKVAAVPNEPWEIFSRGEQSA